MDFYFFKLFFFSIILLIWSFFGLFMMKKNIIVMLMCLELMLLSINLIYLISGSYMNDNKSQILALFIIMLAACESSIGLAILISYYRITGIISVNSLNSIKN